MKYWIKITGDDAYVIASIIRIYKATPVLMHINFFRSEVSDISDIEVTNKSFVFELEANENPLIELVELIHQFELTMILSWQYGMAIYDEAGIRKAELTQEEIDGLDKYTDQYEVQVQNILNDKLDDMLQIVLRRN